MGIKLKINYINLLNFIFIYITNNNFSHLNNINIDN